MTGGWSRIIVGLLAAGTFSVCGSASAVETDSVADADDVDGLLDLAVLKFTKDSAGAPLAVVVRTHDPWDNRVLRDDVNQLLVLLDVNHDGTMDYRARIRKVGADLVVVIGSGSIFEPLPASKPNMRSVRFVIPGDSPPNPNGTAPDMRATSQFIESIECDPASGQAPCVDRAPDAGWLIPVTGRNVSLGLIILGAMIAAGLGFLVMSRRKKADLNS